MVWPREASNCCTFLHLHAGAINEVFSRRAKKRTIQREPKPCLSCLSWKWRKRSPVKIAERIHEEEAAFQQMGRTDHEPEQEPVAHLEQTIQTKDELLAELMVEQTNSAKRRYP